jgi:hypothetical protein
VGGCLVFIFHRLVVDIGKNPDTPLFTGTAVVLVALCSQT